MRLIPIRRSSPPHKIGVVTLLRRVIYGLFAALLAALILAFDSTWPVLQDLIITVLEFAEQWVETFFSHNLGLSHYHAQMATAWLGFFVLLTLGILLIRKALRITRQAKAKLPEWREHQKEVALSWWQHRVDAVQSWWNALSWPRRIGLIAASTLFAVPFFWALAVALASLLSLII